MDSLCFKAGISTLSSSSIFVNGGGLDCRTVPTQVSALGRAIGSASENSTVVAPPQKSSYTGFSFMYPLRSLWPGRGKRNDGISLEDAAVIVGDEEIGEEVVDEGTQGRENEKIGSGEKRENWVFKILHVKSIWAERGKGGIDELEREEKKEDDSMNDQNGGCSCCDDEESGVCGVVEDETEVFDSSSFSNLLRRVSLTEAKLYAQMSYLGNLAYSVPKIKPRNLLKYQGLRFVTSSAVKRAESSNSDDEETSTHVQETENKPEEDTIKEKEMSKKNVYRISASSAYQIAASAASYLHTHTRNILPFKSFEAETREPFPTGSIEPIDNITIKSSEMASFVATTNSVTAVVAAKEETKEAVAKDLNSAHLSPCEWFICDDDHSGTRFFVIQGSESLASWQANLLFEPIQFEGLDVLVHRGIYEAAKGIYEQMLPEVRAHLKSRGNFATFRFTGHSLGGSLSLLVNLMLLIRGEVPASSLLPVITFGSPTIMCGGDKLLSKLGLSRRHVQAITMHRDIVPRAFSCSYPDHVAELLKAVNANFRNHPCLNNQKLLFAPMGEILILQPDEKFSPHHHLLPAGSGLYVLRCPISDSEDAEKKLRAAQAIFFNSPHPLETLSDRAAYGSDGTINRDHDMNSYLRCVRGFIRQELKHARKTKRVRRRQLLWPLLAPQGISTGAINGRHVAYSNIGENRVKFAGVLLTGKESLKRFSRLVASQHMHLLLVLLFPVRFLLLGAHALSSFR